MHYALDERFSAALHSLARGWRAGLDRRLKFLGMSQASWLTIAMAAKSGEGLSQTELANAVGVEGASMVSMIDRLERDGLVCRLPSASDRRIKLITLTDAGRDLYAKVRVEADAYRKELLADVDVASLEQLTELLERLRARVEAAR